MAVTVEEQVIIDLTVELRGLTAGLARARKQTDTTTKAMTKDFVNLGRAVTATYTLIAASAVAAAARQVKALAQVADGWNLVEGRIKLVSASSEDLYKTQDELYKIAQDSRVEYETVADLYARIARNTKQMNIEDSLRIEVTDAIAKSLIISGASAESANAALVQFGQGLAAGALRGQELNSVMEQTPRLSEAIATGMGLTIGQLRKVAEQGGLTAEAVLNAISSQMGQINEEFREMPVTMGQAAVVMHNTWQKLIGDMDDALGLSQSITTAMMDWARESGKNSDQIILATSFMISTISRTIDMFVLLGSVVKLTFRAIYEAVTWSMKMSGLQVDLFAAEASAVFANMMVDVSRTLKEAQEAVGMTFSASDQAILNSRLNTANDALMKIHDTKLLIAADPGFLNSAAMNEQIALTKEQAAIAGKTVEERMAERAAESDFFRKANEFRREQSSFTAKAIEDSKELARMLKSRIRLQTEQLGKATAGGSDPKATEAVINEGIRLLAVVDQALKSTQINAAEAERYIWNIGKAMAGAYDTGAKEIVDANKIAKDALQDQIDLQKALIALRRKEDRQANDYAVTDVTDEIAAIQAAYDAMYAAEMINAAEYRKYTAETNKLAIQEANLLAQVRDALGSQLENAFMKSIRGMMDGVEDWGELFKSILKDILAEMIRILVVKQMAASISSGITGLFADGAAFEGGSVTAFASGGVVSSPTMFPMTTGVGLMGEAGPEAIMPLKRTSSGALGVIAEPSPLSVTVINNTPSEVDTQQDDEGNLRILIQQVEASIAGGIAKGNSPVGVAIQRSYGARR